MKLFNTFKKVDNFEVNNENKKKILFILFIISIILIPFDNLPYAKKILGELSYKGTVYPFIAIICIIFFYTIKNKQIYIPKTKEWRFVVIFFIITIISCLFNISSILNNSFKGRSGINKLLLQLMVLVFVILVSYTVEIIINIKKIKLEDLRRYIMYSLIPVIIYGILELINISGLLDLSGFLNEISYFIHSYSRGETYTKGIRSITGEVSYFAMYASFALPWIISYVFTEKNKNKKILYSFFTLLLLILMIFSKSRTSYVIIFIQLFMFMMFIMIFNKNKSYKVIMLKGITICIIVFMLINNTILPKIGGDNNSVKSLNIKAVVASLLDSNNMSNIARLGLQQSAINIGIKNPVLGVGLGQYGFYTKDNLSEKAKTSLEVQNWINPKINAWPPAFSVYARIIAEQGIVGIISWIILLSYIVIKLLKKVSFYNGDLLGIALSVSFIGILISWWNADTYGQLSFWILLPFVIKYSNSKNDRVDKLSC